MIEENEGKTMLERFTAAARRSVFFARHEAGRMGAPAIATEHLLLGLLHEDGVLRARLHSDRLEDARKRIEELSPKATGSVPAAVDLPLTQEARRALDYAAEESLSLQHAHIDSWHLVLGVMHIANRAAAGLLKEFGIEYETFRLETPGFERPPAAREMDPEGPLAQTVSDLHALIDAVRRLRQNPGQRRLKGAPWTRKQALGHLIDWATAHHQWFARAQAEPRVDAAGYPDNGWPAAQPYEEMTWMELTGLWCTLNGLIALMLARTPQEKWNTPCRIGVGRAVPLQELAKAYVAHCQDIVGQLHMRG